MFLIEYFYQVNPQFKSHFGFIYTHICRYNFIRTHKYNPVIRTGFHDIVSCFLSLWYNAK
uniref:Alternative protein ZNF81 n=1 Tax=Homo sapiens TaxID=9606 RepID=L8E7Y0_HUMAN|nr:alternative protein ZNF81 [Homo sapiens]